MIIANLFNKINTRITSHDLNQDPYLPLYHLVYYHINRMRLFQSYLLLGSKESTASQAQALVQNLQIDITHASLDLTIISPEKKNITISQIRALKSQIFQKPFILKYRLVIIKSFDSATQEAQNALLKILEEPPPHAIIVLEAQNKHLILPTILSRVVTKQPLSSSDATSNRRTEDESSFLKEEKDVVNLLEKVSEVENPQEWLDKQILLLHKALIKNIRAKTHDPSSAKIRYLIENCALAKKMCQANVNPIFVLTNLVFQTH